MEQNDKLSFLWRLREGGYIQNNKDLSDRPVFTLYFWVTMKVNGSVAYYVFN